MSNSSTDFEENVCNTSDSSFSDDEDILQLSEDETSFVGGDDNIVFEEEDTEDEYSYELISVEQLGQLMNSYIAEVNSIMETKPTIIRILLHHFNWDKNMVYETYFDGDKEKLFREAHINSYKPNVSQGETSIVSDDLETCSVCYCEGMDTHSSSCGHKFCINCYEEYLRTKIMDEGVVQTILCPAHNCDVVVDDETIMKMVRDTKVKLRYQLLITKSFVECNQLLQWCPEPLCNNVVKVEYADMQPVTCTCGHTFCFQCSEPWHDPVTCNLLRMWKKKCNDDMTANWLAVNTKACPRCRVSIEKNGGCNHMTCKNVRCKTEFCWTCLELWDSHASNTYYCNSFDKKKELSLEKSCAALKKFTFYSERYTNHAKSLQFEKRLFASIEVIQEIDISETETMFLREAVCILNNCRRTLIYTYIFAYFVNDCNQSRIFVDNQSDLENATEKLSHYLEQELTKETFLDLKIKIQEKYKYCEKRRQVLINHVHEGFDLIWWNFTE